MKTNTFFTAALAATVMFASCDKDGGDKGIVPLGEAARLNISIKAPAMQDTRATSTSALGQTDATVHNYSVFITDQNNDIEWTAYSENGANLQNIETTTSAKHVYVVANAGDITDDYNNVTELLTATTTLDANPNQTDDGATATTGPWSTGVTTTPLDFQPSGTDFVANASVTLNFIATRITLKIVDNMTDYDASASDGSLVLNSVAVINARGESKLFPAESQNSLRPTTYADNKQWFHGLANNNFARYAISNAAPTAGSLLSDAIPTDDFGIYYNYYVFENDHTTTAESTYPTIITIVGTYDGQAIYFPVHLANYEQFSSGTFDGLTRGLSYDIVVTLSGEPKKDTGGNYPGDTGGSTDPTKPMLTGKVNVSITAAAWTPKELNKTFGR